MHTQARGPLSENTEEFLFLYSPLLGMAALAQFRRSQEQ